MVIWRLMIKILIKTKTFVSIECFCGWYNTSSNRTTNSLRVYLNGGRGYHTQFLPTYFTWLYRGVIFLFSWFTFITDIHTNYFFGYSILYAFSRHNRSISINHSSECRLSSGVIPYTLAFTTPMEREGEVFLGLAHQTTLLKTVM